MNIDIDGIVLILALFPVPLAAYCLAYPALRLLGKLRVNRAGWHACELVLGGKLFVPALRLFELFHPLMRLESAARRRLGRNAGETRLDQGVSDVVVELVRMA